MGVKGKNPHNALVVDTFGQVEHASGLLASLLPVAITKHLDLSTLELCQEHLVDEKLRETETDLLYHVSTVGSSEAFVYVLLEHQSTADVWMTFRLLRYMIRVWDTWKRANRDAKKLPPIIPVVLAHAPGGWTAARDLIELFEGTQDMIEVLRPHLPGFAPVLEDLARRSDDELEEMKLSALSRLVVLLLKHSRDGDLKKRLPRWVDTFRDVVEGSGGDALVRVLMYIFECGEDVSIDDLRFVDEAVGTPKGALIMTLAEKLRQEGREEGRKEGQEKQQLKILLRQLELRFGTIPTRVTSRLKKINLADLEKMSERVLTATALDDVLDLSS